MPMTSQGCWMSVVSDDSGAGMLAAVAVATPLTEVSDPTANMPSSPPAEALPLAAAAAPIGTSERDGPSQVPITGLFVLALIALCGFTVFLYLKRIRIR